MFSVYIKFKKRNRSRGRSWNEVKKQARPKVDEIERLFSTGRLFKVFLAQPAGVYRCKQADSISCLPPWINNHIKGIATEE